MSLGDHVRMTHAFLEAFKAVQNVVTEHSEDENGDAEVHAAIEAKQLLEDLRVRGLDTEPSPVFTFARSIKITCRRMVSRTIA